MLNNIETSSLKINIHPGKEKDLKITCKFFKGSEQLGAGEYLISSNLLQKKEEVIKKWLNLNHTQNPQKDKEKEFHPSPLRTSREFKDFSNTKINLAMSLINSIRLNLKATLTYSSDKTIESASAGNTSLSIDVNMSSRKNSINSGLKKNSAKNFQNILEACNPCNLNTNTNSKEKQNLQSKFNTSNNHSSNNVLTRSQNLNMSINHSMNTISVSGTGPVMMNLNSNQNLITSTSMSTSNTAQKNKKLNNRQKNLSCENVSKYLSPFTSISTANRDLNTSMTKLNNGKSIQANHVINSSNASHAIHAATPQVSNTSTYSKFTSSAVNKKSIGKNTKSKILSNKKDNERIEKSDKIIEIDKHEKSEKKLESEKSDKNEKLLQPTGQIITLNNQDLLDEDLLSDMSNESFIDQIFQDEFDQEKIEEKLLSNKFRSSYEEYKSYYNLDLLNVYPEDTMYLQFEMKMLIEKFMEIRDNYTSELNLLKKDHIAMRKFLILYNEKYRLINKKINKLKQMTESNHVKHTLNSFVNKQEVIRSTSEIECNKKHLELYKMLMNFNVRFLSSEREVKEYIKNKKEIHDRDTINIVNLCQKIFSREEVKEKMTNGQKMLVNRIFDKNIKINEKSEKNQNNFNFNTPLKNSPVPYSENNSNQEFASTSLIKNLKSNISPNKSDSNLLSAEKSEKLEKLQNLSFNNLNMNVNFTVQDTETNSILNKIPSFRDYKNENTKSKKNLCWAEEVEHQQREKLNESTYSRNILNQTLNQTLNTSLTSLSTCFNQKKVEYTTSKKKNLMGQVFGNAKHVKSNSMNMNNSFNTGIYSNSNSISNLNSQMYMKTKLKK